MIGIEVTNYIYVSDVLLSRRYITDQTGTAITRSDVSGVNLSVFIISNNEYGETIRTPVEGFDDVSLTVSDVITDGVQTDINNRKYNFNYCVENAFLVPETDYCVEYTLNMADGHTVIIPVYGTTLQ